MRCVGLTNHPSAARAVWDFCCKSPLWVSCNGAPRPCTKERWLSIRGPGHRPHTTAIATATLAGAAAAAIPVDASAFITVSFAASALEDAPTATVPPNKMRSDDRSPEEVSRLREAMRGLDKSSIRISSNAFWAQLTKTSGFQRSPQALYRRWQIIDMR